ncbi:DHHA1 domain-containing protein [Acidobacteriota bacterium]
MTKKIYLEDAYRKEFTAEIIRTRPCEQGCRVVLDRTCFYPEGGGQPCDLGMIGDSAVLDVAESGGEIVHTLTSELQGGETKGIIDWDRRYDHMQQHTGQHLLTRCFLKTAGADTVGFSLGKDYSTIELNSESLSQDDFYEAENRINRIVSEARSINIRWIDREQIELLGIRARGLPEDVKSVRVIEIEGLDSTACGGTHLKNTAEIGPVHIIGTERIRGRQRIAFLCGERAHSDYRRRKEILQEVCTDLSTGADDLREIIRGKISEVRGYAKALESTRLELAGYMAEALFAGAEQADDVRVVAHIVDAWSMREITALAVEIASSGRAVALIGSKGKKSSMAFAASPDSGIDAGKLMITAANAFGAKGGGTAELSRGGCPDPERLEDIINKAREILGHKHHS